LAAAGFSTIETNSDVGPGGVSLWIAVALGADKLARL
jgi:hypothetical protein